MRKKLLKNKSILPILAVLFLLSSCVEGDKETFTWESSVSGAQLGNPEINIISSPDGSELIVSWSVVPGAGGYEVSVYNVDDPDNPVAIGEENQFVDGFEVRRPATEDTKFMAKVRTLDNTKMNNTGAASPATKDYTNLLPVYATIPPGNITDYFAANPVPESTEELCYELEPGGNYTMTGNVTFGKTAVTIRGDKVDHGMLEMTNGSFVVGGAKFKLQFVDANYANYTGEQATSSFILMDANFPAEGLNANGYLVIPSITLQSCKLAGLKYNIFWDNNKKYAITSFIIKDCIIGHSTSAFNQALIRFQAGMVRDLTITNSTFYNDNPPASDLNQRFIQISSGNATSVGPEWLSGTMTITNNTFWQAGKFCQSFNSNGAFGQAADRVIVQKNVFVDCFENGRIISRFRRGNTAAIFAGGENSQWFNGALFTGSQDKTADIGYFETDPQLTYLSDGNFQMNGSAQLAAGTGDPRWLK
ncbi:MAG: DUF4957 domain-containing protein [Tannerella sp.]|jgi:hypothetical protein|nr:DUF4957 domain-containing protein [Tannerella sp.]